ncbi:succinate dehydrogenase assembly factor 2 [Rhizobium johnstonii]|uniref:FAD assembly factor SdhE n=1 Tax=Rhizobium johnstonii (strain DSM 114642 / LMG 32736 / 3841) TaxID=216596 RepID=Q1MGP4_RHIJ3|nr:MULTISPECIES: succinate dehydrogenase assembly factor 2 [Rhizobium]MBB4509940.1 antitoxin CptB [Rhizobium leguminosarum]MBY5373990.1 succinate dehydrogenase assembly factor 2 [Rhizobium leguminosarum]MBY5420467.1 succinate dehydrogenase assembly factor 2 [Rhizobium leguminosarum]NEI00935.1 succinate dehydrogenase assembly factor 2 family protein [Rhizobium leguminosarum]NEI92577.1 succinate dehydrogenase assembly factor 2 family protein [Rhizobium leguminosarum]
MTGVTLTSAGLDPRRRRILFRCWHRGLREMDLVFGQFAEAEIAMLSEAELDEFETIMAEEDNDLVRWIMGTWPVPERFHTPMFARIAAYKPDFDKPLRTPE